MPRRRSDSYFALDSRQIAARAGVSQATVSRVLNGHPGVRPETRERVLQVVKESGYHPNAMARSLVTSRSNLIGLVVSNISNPYYAELVEAVQEHCAALDYQLLVWNSRRHRDLDERFIGMLLERRVEGVIFASVLSESPAVERLIQRGFPVVLTNRYLRGVECDAVLVDNEAGARQAVEHLIRLGHRRIAYVAGYAATTTNQDRLTGYQQALAAAGIPLAPEWVQPGDFTYETAYSAGQRLAAMPDRPTAVLCADDTTAFGLIDGLHDAGLMVPDRMAVIGFDDVSFAALRSVRLTTVRQPVREMAVRSVDLLLERLQGAYRGPPRRVVYPAELMVRATCGAALPTCGAALPTYHR